MRTSERRALGPRLLRGLLFGSLAALLGLGCFDRASRWQGTETPTEKPAPLCAEGDHRCALGHLERCAVSATGALAWTEQADCPAQGLLCAVSLRACAACLPGELGCQGSTAVRCRPDGSGVDALATCSASEGQACRAGSCKDLCTVARTERSNVGCEIWAVDLDNAMISSSSNAAGQQFAVVVSNPQPDVTTTVRVFQDDGAPGSAPGPVEIARVDIPPMNLAVLRLGPREVDGSPEGQFNTGTHTALTRAAYKLTSTFPVVAYQFNPLDNASVFSNDASLLKPREALSAPTSGLSTAYVVTSWPQTIAATDDPNTNFDPRSPIHLRAFLTLVGTAPGTHVRVHPLLHWTERDVWRYIERERIPMTLYFDRGDGLRYRSLGCAPCTQPIASRATTVPEIIAELDATRVAERSLRAQDQESEDAFERLRRGGYL